MFSEHDKTKKPVWYLTFIFCLLRASEKRWSVDVDWLLSLLVVVDSLSVGVN